MHHCLYVLHFECLSLSVTMSTCVKYVQYSVFETVMILLELILDLQKKYSENVSICRCP